MKAYQSHEICRNLYAKNKEREVVDCYFSEGESLTLVYAGEHTKWNHEVRANECKDKV